jgi:hypothetical protein
MNVIVKPCPANRGSACLPPPKRNAGPEGARIELVRASGRLLFIACCYTQEYCNRHAKDARGNWQFQIADLVLCLQWDTRDVAAWDRKEYCKALVFEYPIRYPAATD